MRIGGLLKFSLIDYPGKVAAVIFTQGCNYRCPFCHNPDLVLPELFNPSLSVDHIMAFLAQRRGQLQGVVITGGEPTLHADLKDLLRQIKALGFLVKLDTNGSHPDRLKEILDEKIVDLVAMDIKSSLEGYGKATGVEADLTCVKGSIALIRSSGIPYFFRTTVLKGIVSPGDIRQIQAMLGPEGHYKLQRGNLNGKVIDRSILDGPGEYTDAEWEKLKEIVL